MDLQKRDSAGIVFYRRAPNELQLLVHPGGPYWRNRLEGAWQIPKGAIGSGEAPDAAALREVAEEVGIAVSGPLGPLGTIRQGGRQGLHGLCCRAGNRSGIDRQQPVRTGMAAAKRHLPILPRDRCRAVAGACRSTRSDPSQPASAADAPARNLRRPRSRSGPPVAGAASARCPFLPNQPLSLHCALRALSSSAQTSASSVWLKSR